MGNPRCGRVVGRLRGLMAAALLTALAAPAALADSLGNGWTKVTPTRSVTGLDGGTHRASCSGYPGTSDRYSFYARRGGSRSLMVYFEGGGACWDSLTCTFPYGPLPDGVPQFYSASLATGEKPDTLDGVFNLARADNPVRNWDMVYVPYCTADLHDGAATSTYDNFGHPVYPLPSSFPIKHNGFSNVMVVLDWIKKNIQPPGRVLVTGSSAGGYGAAINFPWVQQVFPSAQMNVLADASQGVTTRGFDAYAPGTAWQVKMPPWAAGQDPANITGPDLLRKAGLANPDVRVAQFTTNFDLEQVQFYGVMKEFYGPGGNCPNVALDWNRQMVGTMNSYRSTPGFDNYRHYLAAGTYHTILTSRAFYTDRSAGLAVNEWLGAMVGTSDWLRHLLWRNLACLGCLIELPCPG